MKIFEILKKNEKNLEKNENVSFFFHEKKKKISFFMKKMKIFEKLKKK